MRYKVADTAVNAFKLAKKVARMVNVEYKVSEYNRTDNVDNVGTVELICPVGQGDGDNDREGISIKPMRVSGRCYIEMNSTAPTTLFRMMIFKGKNERANAYDVQGTGQFDILDPDIMAPLARKSRDNRFGTKILYDRLFTLSTTGVKAKVIDVNIKLFGHINFTAGDVSDSIDDGGIYLLLVSDQDALTPVFRCQLTTTFTDN